MAFICGYQSIKRNPRVLERFEREGKPFLTFVVLFSKKKEVLAKGKQRRLLLLGFEAKIISFEVLLRLSFCCWDGYMVLGFLVPLSKSIGGPNSPFW